MVIFQYLNTIFYVAFGVLLFVNHSGIWIMYTTSILALLGKGVAAAVLGGMHIYGAELFPTVVRASAIGILGFAESVGGITAPQLVFLVSGMIELIGSERFYCRVK